MALKSVQTVNFCGKSSGLADFENTVLHGSAVIFDADSGMFGTWILKEIWIIDLSSALVGMLIIIKKESKFSEGGE